MIEMRRILCPIDFSSTSRHAFDHAVAIAKWYGSTITVFHVSAIMPVPAYAPGPPEYASVLLRPADREALLASMSHFTKAEAGSSVSIQLEIAEGNVVGEILAQAKAMESDLIVMGTHGRSGFERLVLGSVTEKVLRKAACPVLTVPPAAPEVVPIRAGLFKAILCAVDFSDCSMRALNYAMSLAQEADARLTVIHVIELPSDVSREVRDAGLAWPRGLDEYVSHTEADRRVRLKDAVPESVRAYCTVDTMVTIGKPYREILRVATEQHSDLIVVGIHGRGAADRLFFGSTAQQIVRQAACPVLTMRTR